MIKVYHYNNIYLFIIFIVQYIYLSSNKIAYLILFSFYFILFCFILINKFDPLWKQEVKEYEIFYSSKSTITFMTFYLSTSKSTSIKNLLK